MTTGGSFPRIRVILAVGLGLAAGAVMAQLQAILAGMHPPGGAAADLGGLWGPVPNEGHAHEVIDGWGAQAEGPGFRSPRFVVWSFALVDSVLFVTAYAVLLWALLAWLRDALTPAVRAIEAKPVEKQDERRLELLRAYRRLAGFALLLLPLLVLADLLENGLTLGLYYAAVGEFWSFTPVFWLFWTASLAKWILTLLIVVPIAVGTLSLPVADKQGARRVLRALNVARPQLLLLFVFAAAMTLSDQSADALRRWRDEPWQDGAASITLALVLAFVLLVTTRRLFHILSQDRDDPPRNSALALAAAAAIALALAGRVFWGLLALGGILLAIAVLSLLTPSGVRAVHRRQGVGDAARWLPPLIAGVPLVLLGLAVLHAAVPEFAYAVRDWKSFAVLGAVGVLLQAAGWAIAIGFAALLREPVRPQKDEPRWQNVFLLCALVLSAYIGWRIVTNPWRSTELLGTHGAAIAAMIIAAFAVFVLGIFAEAYRPPRAFVALRLKRTPVFVLLLLWLLAAGALDKKGSFYDARLAETTPEAAAIERSALTGRTAFEVWERGLRLKPGMEPVPMIFVAAAGGGIRAGYWAAAVLTCVLEGKGGVPECSENGSASETPFVMSGISGGSLGLAAYTAHVRGDDRADWFDDRLGDDYSAPLVGWALFVDIPLSFVRPERGTDRAEILERAWERSWVDRPSDASTKELLIGTREADTTETELARGLFDLWGTGERFPLLLLNGSKVQDGCRFNASVLALAVDGKDAGDNATTERLVEDCLALRLFEQGQEIYVPPLPAEPGGIRRDDWMLASTDDLSDFICPDKDIRLSTAVLLSARFPWVAPSGRIEKCDRERATNVVDGGYFDTSGASPLVELYAELEQQIEEHNAAPGNRCIVPLYLQIDTGYSDPARTGQARPWEFAVPLQTAQSAREAREANARQAAALAFSGPIPGRKGDEARSDLDRFAHIYPRAHPGSTAPLGWTLSDTARDELKGQLRRNADEIEKVRRWLGSALSCPAAQAARPGP
jgi:hypothetical protein